ncbi:hypothetical protein Y032_0295g1646 [Ancylostoma ceylanicum]|uniref:Uncharacterized protein n=1 Tax=Ancylostoma ceylanicum TaxID=53326 RepID=A0A016S5I3_9BILA|nr:hypothetical protein Y032_0295g1646 [Ancylostoma ceylanicum]
MYRQFSLSKVTDALVYANHSKHRLAGQNKVPRPLVHKSSNQKQLERMLQSATREPPSLKHGSTKANFSQKSMCSPNNDVVVRAQVETYKANETFFISKITSLTFSEGTVAVDEMPIIVGSVSSPLHPIFIIFIQLLYCVACQSTKAIVHFSILTGSICVSRFLLR